MLTQAVLPPGMPFGAAIYGPPFADPVLQATYTTEWKKLARSAIITDDTAKDIVAAVINAALAVGESSLPAIEARVRTVAAQAARSSVQPLLLGAFGAVVLGFAGFGLVLASRRR